MLGLEEGLELFELALDEGQNLGEALLVPLLIPGWELSQMAARPLRVEQPHQLLQGRRRGLRLYTKDRLAGASNRGPGRLQEVLQPRLDVARDGPGAAPFTYGGLGHAEHPCQGLLTPGFPDGLHNELPVGGQRDPLVI
jgi:hypothetical protein